MRKSVVIISLAVALVSGLANGQTKTGAEYGAEDFARFCAECHGASGAGDGPRAQELEPKPANLTQMTLNNNGEFPFIAAYNIIDNGGPIKVHKAIVRQDTPTGMPAWEDFFADLPSPMNTETAIDTRINDLIDFLRTIQTE